MRNFTKDDLVVKIQGASTNKPLKFDASAVVTESLSSKGQLAVAFKGYFSVDSATISIGFKNAAAIRDSVGNPLS